MQAELPKPASSRARKWTKRAGIVAFIFFLGKGLLWLGAILAAYYALK